jgi:hypothetical protein
LRVSNTIVCSKGDHQYYERIDLTSNPNANDAICSFQEGCFVAHDVADFGFLDLVRLGVFPPNDPKVSTSLQHLSGGIIGIDPSSARPA